MLELPGDTDHLSERPGSVAGQSDGNEATVPQRVTLLAERLADREDDDERDDDARRVQAESEERATRLVQQ